MEIKRIFIYLVLFFLLNGCFQSTAMVGPAMTLVSTGNVYQAGFTVGANKAVEEETGMTTYEHLSNLVNNDRNNRKKQEEDFINLVKRNYENTQKKLLLNLVELNYEKTRKKILSDSKN